MRVVFLGTPAFAVPSLVRLAASQHEVAAVVTNPDRAAGRGRKLRPPPVKIAAIELGLPLLQPESPKDPGLIARLTDLAPDAFAVIAFSLLPRRLLAVPRLGSVNVHPSLLPAYRGAAPIVWALFDGCTDTGISTFLLNAKMDAGDILLQEHLRIGDTETAGELEARLAVDGADLLVRSLDGLRDGTITPRAQSTEGASRAPKLTREDARLDWTWLAAQVFNRIRGANPMPGAFTTWAGGALKVHRAELTADSGTPGVVLTASEDEGLVVACGRGAVRLLDVQPEGRPRMAADAFLRGSPLTAGTLFGTGH
ncbi:MAG: methionyl-tRNA formyltransferase [bacterium]|nr:methionyl-tRNA formyltransferase [bacterium]